MEETVVPKRPREEPQVLKEEDVITDSEESSSKRHKPYNHILSLLESEELEDSTQEDLSPLITTLQHELITCPSESDDSHHHHHVHTLLSPSQNNNAQHNNLTTTTTTLEDCSTSTTTFAAATTTPTHSSSNGALEEDDKERVMRHLLEASDDELGIPNRSGELEGSSSLEYFGEDVFSGNGDMFSSICETDGLLWELEDETANYYALLHSELFL